MATIYYRYRVKCATHGFQHWILPSTDSAPTKCPVDSSTIDIDTVSTIVDKVIKDNIVQIKEEDNPTGGHFYSDAIVTTAIGNQVTEQAVVYPFKISAMAICFPTDATMTGDSVDLIVGDETRIGKLTADVTKATAWVAGAYTVGDIVTVTSGTNEKTYTCILDTTSDQGPADTTYWKRGFELNVEATVTLYAKVGYYIKLFDGSNKDEMNRVISIDEVNNKIYVESNLSSASFVGTSTLVLLSVYIMKGYKIGLPMTHKIGSSKIGGSSIAAETEIKVRYDNKSGDQKEFIGMVEFLY